MSTTWTARDWDPLTQLPDLANKTIVITGSNQGIGRATVQHLALRGAKIYLACRTESRALEAISELQTENPSIGKDQLHFLSLDLTNVNSIVDASEQLKQKEQKIDVLINNAAAPETGKRPSSGWEEHIATSHVGHFAFTNLVLPLLKAAEAADPKSDVRIVNVSSNVPGGFLPASFPFNFTSPDGLRTPVTAWPWSWRWIARFLFRADMVTYAVAKTAQLLFVKELQRRLDVEGSRIVVVALNPGGVYTRSAQSVWPKSFDPLLRMAFLTPEQGAKNSAFAAGAVEVRNNVDKFKGQYLEPVGQVVEIHPVQRDEKQIAGLWELTERELNAELKKNGLPDLLPW